MHRRQTCHADKIKYCTQLAICLGKFSCLSTSGGSTELCEYVTLKDDTNLKITPRTIKEIVCGARLKDPDGC